MLVVPAYAKVNLALEVTGRRPDGWHDVATVITLVDWHDLVGLALRPRNGEPLTLRVTGPFAEGVPADEANLAARAAHLLLALAGDPPLSFDIALRKEVPSAAGLGGGSADAAAVLRAGATLLAAAGAPVDTDQLGTAAAELGSDVPALLAGGTLLATGRGEILTRLQPAHLHLAVAVAGQSATAAAYGALTDAERTASGRAARLAAALGTTPRAITTAPPTPTPPAPARTSGALDPALLGSALEPAACLAAPGLADSLSRLRALTPAHPWHLTGSGGAAFAVARDAAHAAELARAAAAAGFPARACRTVARHLGPLPAGATAP